MPVKQKCNIFISNMIFVILVDFCKNFHDFGRFFATWIRIREAGFETDPDPKHCI